MDDRNVKIDSLISTLDRQREMIKEIMYVSPEVQAVIDKIEENIKNNIHTNFILMKPDYFDIILMKHPRLKRNGVCVIYEKPIIIEDSIAKEFELIEEYVGCKTPNEYYRYLGKKAKKMKLKDYIVKIEQIKKEISGCENLIKLYSDKKENLQKEYEKLLENDI